MGWDPLMSSIVMRLFLLFLSNPSENSFDGRHHIGLINPGSLFTKGGPGVQIGQHLLVDNGRATELRELSELQDARITEILFFVTILGGVLALKQTLLVLFLDFLNLICVQFPDSSTRDGSTSNLLCGSLSS